MRKSKEAPFVFGVRVEGDSFTDRREETERLKANFTYGVNTILISPRRMGKTSLVDKVCSLVESEDIRIARIDAFGCRSENDFINEEERREQINEIKKIFKISLKHIYSF